MIRFSPYSYAKKKHLTILSDSESSVVNMHTRYIRTFLLLLYHPAGVIRIKLDANNSK